jgi:tetratricopeptide (TPR) repeat protein
MPADPNRVRDIFLAAIELPLEQRPAYLAEACGGDSDLRAAVERLLVANADPDSILEPASSDPGTLDLPDRTSATQPFDPNAPTPTAIPTAVHQPDGLTETSAQPDPDATTAHGSAAPAPRAAMVSTGEAIGTVIAGRYTLVEVIGEGGMGTVYLAGQTEPVKRQVALKLIKPGMDSRGVMARFDAERQALALMDHPNIARIYDGGVTPAGQPFFVMELVRGVPLTEHCDQQRLTVTARLELFVAVCQAVQHAHQKGIIHRDLKPGNVLVTEVDGRPTPKVIDFGVAKATEVNLTDMSFSDTGMIVGTPAYMSPEQADPSSMDIDTRTDVYALGVTLYELLVGSPPLEGKDFKRGALLEMLRMVREVDPPRPSTKLNTAKALPNIAANRSIEPARLAKLLHGELDWVVMKALEKDRTRRYETASGFARDIQRYLADEVVEARPPSGGYRLKKFVKRNKVHVIAASLVFLTLVGGIIGTSLGMAAARRAQQAEAKQRAAADAQRDKAIASETKARDEAAKAQTINDFLAQDLLTQAEPANNAVEDKVTLLEVLDRAAEKVGTRFAGQPELERSLRATIADTYHGLASWGKAELQWRAVLEAARKRDPQSADAYEAQGFLSHILLHRGRRDAEVLAVAEAAARGLERTLDTDNPRTLRTLNNLGLLYLETGKLPEAIAVSERVRDARIAALGPDHPDTLTSLNTLARAYHSADRLPEAIALYERARDAQIAKLGPDHLDTLVTLNNLAGAYQAAGRLPEAIVLFERVRDAQIAKLGPDHPGTLTSLNNLGRAYRFADRLPEAIVLLERARGAQIATVGPDHADTLTTLENLAGAYQAVGRSAEAIALFERVRDARIAALGPDHPDTLITLSNLAAAYQFTGRHAEAIALFERVRDAQLAKLGPDHSDTLGTLTSLAEAYSSAKQLDKSVALLVDVLRRKEAKLGADHPATLQTVNNLGVLYLRATRLPEAIVLLERVRDAQLAKLGPDHSDTLATLNNLAGAYWRTKQLDKSVPLFEDVLKRQEAKLGRQHSITQTTVANLGVNYKDAGRLKEAIPLLEEAYQSAKRFPSLRWVANQLIDAYTKAGETAKLADLLQEQLAEARKALPKDSPQLAGMLAHFGLSLLQQKNWTEAEPLLRECLAIREKAQPDVWSTFNTKSLLGGALLGQKRIAEAEPLLLAGYEGMKQRETTIPEQGKIRLREAADRLIKLYTATNRPDELKKWQAERAKYPKAGPTPTQKK